MNFHEVIAKEDPMDGDISEVLEILRRPLPSDSLLEFIVSEDGYKKIIGEREKSNRKVWYDGESRKVTINCCPSYLHEHTSLMVVDSMVDEACLVKDGVDVTDAIPHDLTVEVGDFVTRNWLSDDVVRRLAVNFLQPQTFLEGLSNSIVGTALNRVEDNFEVEEH
ncbi:hypothetical protein V1522DRAFT_420895 [Lipomyces starkeyi]